MNNIQAPAAATSPGNWASFALAIAGSIPWAWYAVTGTHPSPPIVAMLAGISILAAAFLLSWIVDAAELDVPPTVAVSLLALIAVLPEYAVDATFAWKAATDPIQASYAVANMTGGNRLLLGLGWSSLVFLAWFRFRETRIRIPENGRVDLTILIVASLYSLVPIVRGSLNLVDTGVFVLLYAVYMVAAVRCADEDEHEELVGPAALLDAFGPTVRRCAVVLLFLWSATMIFVAAEPFAHALVTTGIEKGIDEFLLVQWVAPLASESPEFAVAWLLILRKRFTKGMMLLISSKVNQWTLLVGTLPVVTSIASGEPAALDLDARQQSEILLTAMQSVFGVALLTNLALGRWQALMLAMLFLGQLAAPEARNAIMIAYVVGTIGTLALSTNHRRGLIAAFRTTKNILFGN